MVQVYDNNNYVIGALVYLGEGIVPIDWQETFEKGEYRLDGEFIGYNAHLNTIAYDPLSDNYEYDCIYLPDDIKLYQLPKSDKQNKEQ